MKIEEKGEEVRNHTSELLEKNLNKLSAFASYFQWWSTMLFALLAGGKWMFVKYIDVYSYSFLGQGFCISAFLLTFILNRLFAYSKRRLGEAKELSEVEISFLKHEYLGKFLFPHIFWAGMFAVFHWVIV